MIPPPVPRQIRDRLSALISAETGRPVLRAPRWVIAEADLPAIAIFGLSDRPQDEGEDCARRHLREYRVAVEIRVQDRPEDDATDDLATLVTRAVLLDDTLGGLCTRTTGPVQQWDGAEEEQPEGATRLEFVFTYWGNPIF